MARSKKNSPADTAWPPAGIRDLKPDIRVSPKADSMRFPSLHLALGVPKVCAGCDETEWPCFLVEDLCRRCQARRRDAQDPKKAT